MDSTDSGDSGFLRNFSVLLPSHLGFFSHLPAPCPLSSLEEVHRMRFFLSRPES
jgi:hypothetical protein